MNSIENFEKNLNYKFKDKGLLITALTHSSYANECSNKNCESYERLEFLGDSVLGLITSEYIFDRFRDLHEGKLTRIRASLVCEKTLKNFANELKIGDFLRLSHGEERTGGRCRPSILADAFESVVASLFLDGGMEVAKKFVLKFISSGINDAQEMIHDYKTEIQEFLQSIHKNEINYSVIDSYGPDHAKTFTVQIELEGIPYGQGVARSKKEAEQLAAKSAIEKLISQNSKKKI